MVKVLSNSRQKGSDTLDVVFTFIVSVMAGVVSYYICKWLEGDK